ncbi:MAG: acylphosphatase [Candidatus Pacearchaeota archaeon]|jgi:acylphosphatase
MKTLRILLSGTVQGYLFRNYLEEEGKKIGVRGFVRQTEAGKVEVVIEGIDEKVSRMLEVCRAGTKHAQVNDVNIQELKFQGFEGFKQFKL